MAATGVQRKAAAPLTLGTAPFFSIAQGCFCGKAGGGRRITGVTINLPFMDEISRVLRTGHRQFRLSALI
jgi:hypothetical protein